jgi:Ca2+-binding RTX toxin-like protein
MKNFEINVTGGNRVDGTSGPDTFNGTAANDYYNGGAGNDTITGGSGNDALLGETGNDILNGGDGTDHLYGGANNDTLHGGAGADVLQGGTGNDILFGNAGADLFIWGGGDNGAVGSTDIIKDFNLTEGDKVDAKALLDALGWNGNMGTLSQFVSVTGNTIDIHNAADTISVNIVVEGQTFTDLNDMIAKTNFQTT